MINKVFTLLALSIALSADIGDKLEEFYKSCGSAANVTSADAYQGQKAGYYSGGSLAVRNKVMDSKLMGITLPNINAGCGGIDIYTGGFSFINSDELIQTLKSIGSNAVGYAFLLAMETISPQVSNNIRQLQSWANMINGVGINSCEAAATLVGAVMPPKQMASEHICQSFGTQYGAISDRVAGRHKCNSPSKDAPASWVEDHAPEVITEEYNIAWEAIRKQEALATNTTMAELFLSLTGSLISRKEGDPSQYRVETLRSKVDDEGFLHALISGGEVEVYKCVNDETNKCLFPREVTIKIPKEKSWLYKIQQALFTIQNKILRDEELSEEEKQLIDRSSLPLYKMINVITAYRKGKSPVELYQYADIIGMDILCQFLREVVTLSQDGANHLHRGQMFDTEISDFLKQLSDVEHKIALYETRGKMRMDQEFQLIQKVQLIEEQLRSEFRM